MFQQKNSKAAFECHRAIHSGRGTALRSQYSPLQTMKTIYPGHNRCLRLLQCAHTRAGDFRCAASLEIISDAIGHSNSIMPLICPMALLMINKCGVTCSPSSVFTRGGGYGYKL